MMAALSVGQLSGSGITPRYIPRFASSIDE
jgi:hypothetical protein